MRIIFRLGVGTLCLAFGAAGGAAQNWTEAAKLALQARAYFDQGRYHEAEPLYQQSLTTWETLGGLIEMAEIYRTQGNYERAERLAVRALEISREAPPNAENLIRATAELGSICLDQGRLPEAQESYEEAQALAQKAYGAEHPTVGCVLKDMAKLCRRQGYSAKAEALYRRSIALLEAASSPGPDLALAMNGLAELYFEQRRFTEAQALARRSLAIMEQAVGPEHPHVATILNNLAAIHQTEGRHSKAEPLYRRALEIRRKVLGPAHPHLAVTLANFAELCRAHGNYSEAASFSSEALDILERVLGPGDPRVARARAYCAAMRRKARRTNSRTQFDNPNFTNRALNLGSERSGS